MWMVGALLLGACAAGDDATSTTEAARSVRILALGDSYTIGQSVDEADRWPVQLGRALEDGGVDSVDVEIIARTGWTTADLDAGIDAADPQGPFDLVTLLIGVNNQFQGRDIDEYRTEFVTLLGRAVAFAGGDPGRVIAVSIPDWGVTPFGSGYGPERVAEQIDAFNAVGEEEALGAGAHWVDITPISREGDPALVATDELHPSGVQYARWVEEILPVAVDTLNR